MKQQILKVSIFTALCALFLLGANQYVHAVAVGSVREIRDHNYYFEQYDIKVIESPSIETEFPTRATPDPTQTNSDLNYWVHDVLPYAEDKNEPGYIVYPEHGIVVPMIKPNDYDQNLVNNGHLFDHYGYLEQGALHYFGKSPDEGVGNMVVAAHSSFKKSEPGNYKTVFQALPISLPGDKIFVYIKNDKGLYDFYEYTISSSFETDKYDVSVLRQDVDIPTLTTYGCYTIGSNEDRWINVATLTDMIADHSDLYPVQGQQLVQNDGPEHAVAYTTQSTDSKETGTIGSQLSQKSIAVEATTPTQSARVDSHQVSTYQAEHQSAPEPVVATANTVPEPTSMIPITFRIKYQALIRKTAYSLFQKTIGSPAGMERILQIIDNLKQGFSPDAFESYILTMLEEELNEYE